MDQVAQAIEQFEIDARAAGVSERSDRDGAKYALAATADDIVQNLPTADSRVWTQYSMLVRFFNERMGGVRFFQELERAKQNPAVNLGVLEIMHACLSLGFEGVYRASGGPGAVQGIRRDLYETIRRAQPKTIEDLSPHWRGQDVPLASSRLQVPVWAVAALAAVILLGVLPLSAQRPQRPGRGARVEDGGHASGDARLTIARENAVVKPPPDPTPRTSRRNSSASARRWPRKSSPARSAPTRSATTIFIRIGNVVLFPSGGAKVNEVFAPIAAKIAAALDKEPGAIHVDGYTDTDPINTVAFPSNFELSEARAKSVAAHAEAGALAAGAARRCRARAPTIRSRRTTSRPNKSKNRRVEVSIPRAD